MKLDMLFFLGVFATVFGVTLVAGWFIFGGTWNLYGILMLAIGVFLVIIRPKPPIRFFIGHLETEASTDQDVQCWCGRSMKAKQVCEHGELKKPDG